MSFLIGRCPRSRQVDGQDPDAGVVLDQPALVAEARGEGLRVGRPVVRLDAHDGAAAGHEVDRPDEVRERSPLQAGTTADIIAVVEALPCPIPAVDDAPCRIFQAGIAALHTDIVGNRSRG